MLTERGSRLQPEPMGEELDRKLGARRQAEVVASLRRMARGTGSQRVRDGNGASQEERCDLCGTVMAPDHRHLLHLTERRILCVCESCLALRGGDAEYRPTGTRVAWLADLELPDELWATFSIPIGLAFFLRSSVTGGVVAFYPSPAGATESELDMEAWEELVRANPILASLENDAEALVVNRLAQPNEHAIAPIDECYRLVGMIKISWQGVSGGSGPEEAIASFFAELRERAQ
jgi:hypothetical protein